MSDLRLFTAPSRYLQGPGAVDELGRLLKDRYSVAAVIIDSALAGRLAPRILRSLEGESVRTHLIAWTGEVTRFAIDGLAEQLHPYSPNVVIAAGGGKTLDTGKGVSVALGVDMVTVPTIASNDGPTSRTIAEYDEHHRLISTPQMPANPAVVVVDTDLIAQAPADFLLSGIGDALAKRFEAAGCYRAAGNTPNGTRPLDLPSAIADACYRTILTDTEVALTGLGSTPASPQLERVIEAVVLMSGLAFENGGLSLAHALTRGLMRVEGAKMRPHGIQVAYGLLIQLAHEGDEESLAQVGEFFKRVSLPRGLGDLGTEASPSVLEAIAEAALSAPHCLNTVPVPTRSSLVAAMEAIERDLDDGGHTWM
ncbi:MAG: glycerol dehydrogenase [Acidobacteriota bacterium]|nr:glycerol dehydrogenase [Acidobacteriota bacterium]